MANKNTNTKTATTTSTKKPASKKAQAIKIVKRMNARKTVPARKVIIDELMTKVGLSQNGAATYYQNCTMQKPGWS